MPVRISGRRFPGRKEEKAGEDGALEPEFPRAGAGGRGGSCRLHDAVDPGEVRSDVRVETEPLMSVGEDAIGFVVADERIPSVAL